MQIDFYHLSRRAQDAGLIALLSKMFETGQAFEFVCSDLAEAQRWDTLLWTAVPDSFWPHGLEKEGSDVQCLISTQMCLKNNPAFVVFFNTQNFPDTLPEVSRILIPFNGEDAGVLAAARLFYKRVQEANIAPSYWKHENSKWIKKGD